MAEAATCETVVTPLRSRIG